MNKESSESVRYTDGNRVEIHEGGEQGVTSDGTIREALSEEMTFE